MPRLSRRDLLQTSSFAIAGAFTPTLAHAAETPSGASTAPPVTRLCFNENPYGPSPAVAQAIARELTQVNRYADETSAAAFAQQIAAYEQVPVEQVVLGEILDLLGLIWARRAGRAASFSFPLPAILL